MTLQHRVTVKWDLFDIATPLRGRCAAGRVSGVWLCRSGAVQSTLSVEDQRRDRHDDRRQDDSDADDDDDRQLIPHTACLAVPRHRLLSQRPWRRGRLVSYPTVVWLHTGFRFCTRDTRRIAMSIITYSANAIQRVGYSKPHTGTNFVK